MKKLHSISYLIILFLCSNQAFSQNPSFPWPEGKKMALSLSFDDARASGPKFGVPLLNEYGVKATFFVVPPNLDQDLEGWKMAVETGHEMANHSLQHPCSGNFLWSRNKALEDYTMNRMRDELVTANDEVERILGVRPEVYAYPCGLTSIGRGSETQSFVPLISELFLAGRGWLDEAPVDPYYADMAQLTGVKMDNMSFDEILPIIESAAKNGQWLILAGHETKDEGDQTTYLNTLRQIVEYALDPKNGIWIEPIGPVAKYVNEKRKAMEGNLNIPGIVRPSQEGSLELTAENGKGIGPDIKYMPEWNAFGWFTGKDKVEWDVDVPEDGIYEIWLEWSVSDEESGKEFMVSSGEHEIKGLVGKSGSWETFKKVSIGKMKLNADYNKITLSAVEDFENGALMDVRALVLEPLSKGTD